MTNPKKRRTVSPALPPCEPQGDLRPWVDDRAKTCTLCATPVTLVPRPSGSDWVAIDETGSPAGRAEMPPLCPCSENDGLRHVDPPRWYGPMLPAAAWFGGFHTHNAKGGPESYLEDGPLPTACGCTLPPTLRSTPLPPLGRMAPMCCGQGMRWIPRGWQCRVSGQCQTPAVRGDSV